MLKTLIIAGHQGNVAFMPQACVAKWKKMAARYKFLHKTFCWNKMDSSK